jgi:hypothetical protein
MDKLGVGLCLRHPHDVLLTSSDEYCSRRLFIPPLLDSPHQSQMVWWLTSLLTQFKLTPHQSLSINARVRIQPSAYRFAATFFSSAASVVRGENPLQLVLRLKGL